MSVIIIPRKHLRQPQGRVALDDVHWARSGLVHAVCPSAGVVDLASGAPVVRAANSSTTVAPHGVSLKSTSEYDGRSSIADTAANSSQRVAVIVVGDFQTKSVAPLASKRQSFSIGWGLYGSFSPLTSNSFPVFAFFDGAAWRQAQSTLSNAGTVPRAYVGSYDGNTVRLHVDGGLMGSSAHVGSIPDVAAEVTIGACTGETTGADARISFFGLVDIGKAPASEAALSDLSANPWQLFRADPIRIYSLPSGPISWSSLTASGITPTGATLTIGGITR